VILELVLLALACLLLPAAWGVLIYFLFMRLRLDKWLPSPEPLPPAAPLDSTGWDYQI
jgi:hypothetical protein